MIIKIRIFFITHLRSFQRSRNGCSFKCPARHWKACRVI